ncbi:YceI family protein [Gordonia humi]|uniref:Polyisoprenoid-binding protein YceI n=1 Tax=Gordonia humi TaxID=686429 RepID=A0A840F7Q6_9ACTN|nr:YceI family protein [Gordonia humi]MBB4135557.1 polyisoprenoid-binding protein YceI [Gordonia humi]
MAITIFGPDTGDLTLRTGVTGKAARTGHRLTIGFTDWSATVDVDAPSQVAVRVAVGSLEVRGGEGGLTPMTAPERLVARTNALKSLKADKHPEIVFTAPSATPDGDGYRFDGTLTIAGASREHSVRVTRDGDRATGSTRIRHADFGLKQYSLMMGALKVADEVDVEWSLAL